MAVSLIVVKTKCDPQYCTLLRSLETPKQEQIIPSWSITFVYIIISVNQEERQRTMQSTEALDIVLTLLHPLRNC